VSATGVPRSAAQLRAGPLDKVGEHPRLRRRGWRRALFDLTIRQDLGAAQEGRQERGRHRRCAGGLRVAIRVGADDFIAEHRGPAVGRSVGHRLRRHHRPTPRRRVEGEHSHHHRHLPSAHGRGESVLAQRSGARRPDVRARRRTGQAHGAHRPGRHRDHVGCAGARRGGTHPAAAVGRQGRHHQTGRRRPDEGEPRPCGAANVVGDHHRTGDRPVRRPDRTRYRAVTPGRRCARADPAQVGPTHTGRADRLRHRAGHQRRNRAAEHHRPGLRLDRRCRRRQTPLRTA
jgi:hypothetical protein